MKRFKMFFILAAFLTLVLNACENPAGNEDPGIYPEGAVEDIINLPYTAYVNTPKPLTGKIIPEDPARTIVWEIKDAGTTGAIIDPDTATLNTTNAGTVWITARVVNGIKQGRDFARDFGIEVIARPSYGIEVNIAGVELDDWYPGYDFVPADSGYSPITPIQVGIENPGINATGALTIALTAGAGSNFEVFPSSIDDIAPGGNASFTVGPKAGLAVGTYTDTVTISGGNDINKSFGVNFTVTLPAGEQSSETPSSEILSSAGVNFRYIPPSGGYFRVDENTENKARITRGYWMMETEVTQELWEEVMGGENNNPSYFKTSPDPGGNDKKLPVDSVSWYAAIAFCNKLSVANGKKPVYTISGITDWSALDYGAIPVGNNNDWNAVTMDYTANGYRLPTEIEWLWAAMDATKDGQSVYTEGWQKAYAGSAEGPGGNARIEEYAWITENSGDVPHEVGTKAPSRLGLYDMAGNVWEWCWDWFQYWYEYYEGDYIGEVSDYTGVSHDNAHYHVDFDDDDYTNYGGKCRIVRGGSHYYYADECSLGEREYAAPPVLLDDDGEYGAGGFRIVFNE
jgi:formylglycine-generating enzyme required for sulfatase activity